MNPLTPGRVLERYVVEERVGQGGMCEVFRVKHRVLGSVHALKVLDAELAERPDMRDRFLAEGRDSPSPGPACRFATGLPAAATVRLAGDPTGDPGGSSGPPGPAERSCPGERRQDHRPGGHPGRWLAPGARAWRRYRMAGDAG